MDEKQKKELRDDARCEMVIVTMKEMLIRAEEMSEGSYGFYDMLGFLFEDIIRDGGCPVCLQETLDMVVNDIGADMTRHVDDSSSVLH